MQTMKQSKNSNNVTNGTVVTKSNANKKQASKQANATKRKERNNNNFLNKNCANTRRGIQITSNCSRLSAGWSDDFQRTSFGIIQFPSKCWNALKCPRRQTISNKVYAFDSYRLDLCVKTNSSYVLHTICLCQPPPWAPSNKVFTLPLTVVGFENATPPPPPPHNGAISNLIPNLVVV